MSTIYRGRTMREFYLASTLYSAIEDLDFRSVEILLNFGADPNLVLPKNGIAPFHLIIGNESREFAVKVTKLFLKLGANPNIKSEDGLTPVHIAAAWGCFDILQLLLNCGGDPELYDTDMRTPLYYAEQENFIECSNLLKSYIDKGAAMRLEKNDNCSLVLDKILISNAATIGEYEIINEYKPDINKSTIFENLPKSNCTDLIIDWFDKSISLNKVETTTNNSPFSENDSKIYKIDENVEKNTLINSPKHNGILEENDKNLFTSQITNTLNSSIGNCSVLSGFKTISTDKNPESSSDYMTCCSTSHNSLNNIFERNIFQINNNNSLITNDESNNSEEGIETSNDFNFINVSEIYKYVDEETKIVLYEKRLLKTSSNSDLNSSEKSLISNDYDSETIRKELTSHGYNPGPITFTTKRIYLKKLQQLSRTNNSRLPNEKEIQIGKRVYSYELEKTLKNADWLKDLTAYKTLEDVVFKQFSTPDSTRKWREGFNKCSFTYLLLDPHITNNLPFRAETLPTIEVWKCFLSSIFYVGKGKRARPYSHLYNAVELWHKGVRQSDSKKLQRILNIWSADGGVVCLHVFQNIIPVEAYTREAAMISALGLENVCNVKSGDFYGATVAWPLKDKKMLGVYLLHKALAIFLNEGERQLRPEDID